MVWDRFGTVVTGGSSWLLTLPTKKASHYGARDGMIRAVSATGGVITSAGIVLAAVFCVLGVLPPAMLQVMPKLPKLSKTKPEGRQGE